MMTAIEARAPGKAVLLGEYAVLAGAPALAMAVNRYARVRFLPCAAADRYLRASQLGVEALGFSAHPGGRLAWDQAHPGWSAVASTASVFAHLHARVAERYGEPAAFAVDIDTSDLYVQHRGESVKLGLGSSSAVAVALDAGLRRLAGGEQGPVLSTRALDRLLTPYRRAQDGQGSGIDLATSLCGGLIGFQRLDDGFDVRRLALPDGFSQLFVWTGRPASTPALLARFQQWRVAEPDQAAAMDRAMIAVSERAREALARGDGEALVEQFRAYGGLMGTMGGLMGVDLNGHEHAAIRARAESLGVAYKPSGAGVGDLGVAVATEPQRLHRLAEWIQARGLPILDLVMDGEGVRVAPLPVEPA